jgi:hypothetical protein
MSKENTIKKKFILPMEWNIGQQKYEPDIEKIKEIANSLRKGIKKLKIKK